MFSLHAGATRGVLVIGSVAIKIPLISSWYGLLSGLISNLNEASVWEDFRDDPRLAPMVWSAPLGLLNVMARADDHDGQAIATEDYEELAYDLHPENFGVYQGRVVLRDYA